MEGTDGSMSMDECLFFQGHPDALPVYEQFRLRVLAQWPDVEIRTARTQISFFRKTMMCCASFLPLGRKAERPDSWLVISFGLDRLLETDGISVGVQAAPGRWTHHVMISSAEEMNDAFWAWIRMAADFSMRTRRGSGRNRP